MDAIEVMMAEEKLKGSISEPFDFRGVQAYHHALADRFSASGYWSVSAFYSHEAESTGSEGRAGLSDGAKIGDVKSIV